MGGHHQNLGGAAYIFLPDPAALDEATCAAINLAYRDPGAIDTEGWRADPDTLVVAEAGQDLYRLGSPSKEPNPHEQRP